MQEFIIDNILYMLDVKSIISMMCTSKEMMNVVYSLLPNGVYVCNEVLRVDLELNRGETRILIPISSYTRKALIEQLNMDINVLFRRSKFFIICNQYGCKHTLYWGNYIKPANFYLGMLLDVCATWGEWKEASVIRVEHPHIFVRFYQYNNDYRFHCDSPRLAYRFQQT